MVSDVVLGETIETRGKKVVISRQNINGKTRIDVRLHHLTATGWSPGGGIWLSESQMAEVVEILLRAQGGAK